MQTKRYQNISTLLTSVQRGDKSVSMKPGQIVSLREEDVQATKDAYVSYDKNPFDLGILAEVPDGASQHPDWVPVGRTIRPPEAERLVLEAPREEVEQAIRQIGDAAAMNTMNAACTAAKDKIPDRRLRAIEGLLEEQASRLRGIIDGNNEKYGKLLST